MTEKFLHAQLSYSFFSGPDEIASLEDARILGINCGALAHLVISEIFDISLPRHLLPIELYYDREFLEEIQLPIENSKWQIGDIAFFGSHDTAISLTSHIAEFNSDGKIKNWAQHPHLHVAVCTGEFSNGLPTFIHATNFRKKSENRKGDILVWTFEKFLETKTYSSLCAVRRLRIDKRKTGAP